MPAYGKVKVDTITYDLSGTATDVSVANIATKASPTFTGTVTVPTPTAGDNSTKAASTAFVAASFAPLASPTFTGSPTVPGYAALSGATFTGTVNGTSLVLSADLTVNGTTTTINTTTLQVEDKNIEIGKVSTPSDTTADGGGLTLLGATNKTWNWVNSTDAWTSSEHIHVLDSKKLLVGTDSDLQIYHTGSVNEILSSSGALYLKGDASNVVGIQPKNGENSALFFPNGAAELYYDNSKKFETTNLGIKFSGYLQADDGQHIRLGTSDDFNFYHSGNENIVDCANGHQLHLKYGTEHLAKFIPDGAVELYHDNSKKLETASGGVTVTGTLAATAVTGDGSGLTNLPPGGNTFTAVADGAIATNKCVKLKTNGKIEEISEVITGENPGDDNSVEVCSSTSTSNVSLVYDPDQDKIICYYTSSYANDNMKYSVMSISSSQGRAQGFGGSDTGIESSIKVNGAYEWGTACYDTQNNKHIWAGRCRNDNNVYVGVGTYDTSNNTITWPSGKSNYSQPNGANNNARIPTLYFDDTTNRIVCLLRDDSNNEYPYVVIGTYNSSSGSIDWGTKQQLDSTDIRDNNTIVCKAGTGTGKVFIGYRSSTNALKGNLITVSTSSNTCTVESSATIIAGAGSIRGAYNVEDNYILIAYEDVNDSSKGKLRRLTLSGTGFTASSALTFCVNDQPSRWDVVYNTTGKQCYVFFRLSSSNNRLNAFRVTNTSGTPTKSSDVQGRYDSTLTNSAQIGICMANRNSQSTNDDLYAAFIYSGNDKAYIETWACLSSTSNQTGSNKHQYVGFVDQAYSDGQTATIITYGNTKSGLSGLTTGSKYFVASNGNLSTSDNGLGHAGLALAADKLLIKEPEI